MSAYLCIWIPVCSWLDVDGVRHTRPAHLFCSSVPWRRRR